VPARDALQAAKAVATADCRWCQFHSRSAGCARPIDAGFLKLIDGYTSRPPSGWASRCPVYTVRPANVIALPDPPPLTPEMVAVIDALFDSGHVEFCYPSPPQDAAVVVSDDAPAEVRATVEQYRPLLLRALRILSAYVARAG
jgi:hypothetical protein